MSKTILEGDFAIDYDQKSISWKSRGNRVSGTPINSDLVKNPVRLVVGNIVPDSQVAVFVMRKDGSDLDRRRAPLFNDKVEDTQIEITAPRDVPIMLRARWEGLLPFQVEAFTGSGVSIGVTQIKDYIVDPPKVSINGLYSTIQDMFDDENQMGDERQEYTFENGWTVSDEDAEILMDGNTIRDGTSVAEGTVEVAVSNIRVGDTVSAYKRKNSDTDSIEKLRKPTNIRKRKLVFD